MDSVAVQVNVPIRLWTISYYIIKSTPMVYRNLISFLCRSSYQVELLKMASTDTMFIGDLAIIVFGEKPYAKVVLLVTNDAKKSVDTKPALNKQLLDFIYGEYYNNLYFYI